MSHTWLMDTTDVYPGTFVGGHGSWLIRDNGASVLDLFTDTGTNPFGYSSIHQTNALGTAIEDVVPLHAPKIVRLQVREEAARQLCIRTGMEKVFFTTSGAESVETAIKLARIYHHKFNKSDIEFGLRKHTVYSLHNGFHGRTYATLAAGDGPAYHKMGFGPLPYGFQHFGWIEEIDPCASAVLLSPLPAANDVSPLPIEFLRQLREFTQKHGILLIFDEVQSGAGRCGDITYARAIGVQPDILCLAKGIGMGVPVGATLAQGVCANAFGMGEHFSTFGASPLQMHFVLHMLNALDSNCLARVRHAGAQFAEWLDAQPWTGEVRQVGLMIAADTKVDARVFAKACFERGVLLGAFRSSPLKITPPLNILDDEIEIAKEVFSEVIQSCF